MLENIKIVVIVGLMFFSLFLASIGRADGFYISTKGDAEEARSELVRCLTFVLTEATPLEPSAFKDSVLDISVIVMKDSDNYFISSTVELNMFPTHHALMKYSGSELNLGQVVCEKVSGYIDTVIRAVLQEVK